MLASGWRVHARSVHHLRCVMPPRTCPQVQQQLAHGPQRLARVRKQRRYQRGLVSSAVELKASSDTRALLSCERFLLLLDKNTWTSRGSLDLAEEITTAVRHASSGQPS